MYDIPETGFLRLPQVLSVIPETGFLRLPQVLSVIARLLIEEGADTTAKDVYQRTPQYRAAENGHTDLARDLEDAAKTQLGNATYKLFDAAQSGSFSDAEAALAAGADPTARDNRQWTPLHWAAQKGHTDLASMLESTATG